jgi:hypothetical protein
MAQSPSLRIVVELDRNAGPIAGRVTVGEAAAQRFTGWLELCALLEDARRYHPVPEGVR